MAAALDAKALLSDDDLERPVSPLDQADDDDDDDVASLQQDGEEESRHTRSSGDDAKVDTLGVESTNGDTERTSGAGGNGKIFIGGLSWDTTSEKLEHHFRKYGEITDAVIMRDRGSGTPRGFGFVTFADPAACELVLQHKHVLDGRTVECKRSIPRESIAAVKGPKTKKIFVGGIPPSISEDEFKSYFSGFGSVVEHQIMQDHNTGRSRGFGFIVFDSEQTVEDVLAHGRMHELGGKQVEIKKAEPKKAMQDPAAAGGYYGPSRGGGYGSSAGAHYGGGGYPPDYATPTYASSYRSGAGVSYGASRGGAAMYAYGGGGGADGYAAANYAAGGYLGLYAAAAGAGAYMNSYPGGGFANGLLSGYGDDGYPGVGYCGGGYGAGSYGGGGGGSGGGGGGGHGGHGHGHGSHGGYAHGGHGGGGRSHAGGSRYHPYSRY